MDEKKEMTVREAGRLGGTTTVKKMGKNHMAEIGRKGGKASPTKFQKGAADTILRASKGGSASGGNFANCPERAREASQKAHMAKSLKRLAILEANEEMGR